MTELYFPDYSLAEFRVVVWKMAEKLPCLSYSWESKPAVQPAAFPGCPAGFVSFLDKGKRVTLLQHSGAIFPRGYMGSSGLFFRQLKLKLNVCPFMLVGFWRNTTWCRCGEEGDFKSELYFSPSNQLFWSLADQRWWFFWFHIMLLIASGESTFVLIFVRNAHLVLKIWETVVPFLLLSIL